MFDWWAIFIISDPGSATPGQPASETKPILWPWCIGSKKEFNSSFTVNLFIKFILSEFCALEGVIFLINFLPAFSFSNK